MNITPVSSPSLPRKFLLGLLVFGIFFYISASPTCPIPKAPKNGEALGLLYKGGDKAVYSCYHGYKLNSRIAQTCKADGSWVGDIPECIKGAFIHHF